MSEVNPSTETFTCVSCRVAFKEAEIQRLHYKSDWHRYNLKRKVADLPPVTSEEFQRRVYNQRNADESSKQDQTVYCDVCRKSFSNSNAYQNHLNSKKHKDNEKNYEPTVRIPKSQNSVEDDAMSVEEVDSDEWENTDNPIDNNDCLFCMEHSRNFLKNLEHMTLKHSFFIPDIEYCTDVEGLLHYLGEKISAGFMCLWCNENGRTFHSAEAARAHMVDKGHCKMIHEGIALAEYSDFYDYSTSYPDAEDEDVSSEQEVNVTELDGSDYQLVLPSGVTVGHRSLMRYYRQSANPNKALVTSTKGDRKLHKVLASYRALGWTDTDQKAVAKKARDIHYMKRMQSKYMTKLGVKNNLMQPHFRRQVNF
ncbi:cytoplasmic 60S subunit biogenesis factor ZNF622 [Anthonomus grandis grandis]|uniref:cytoplasmic 60S subunit biogenesis factor ZNF622 n=1 Tax=Anthonomus grandis grandis TaxID=2921223 RepID=UPI0021662E91|nr:cytoplasmic 60S subunit biogenesis factor ZNF622 [Anthonomus grandis grandis]